MLSEKIASALQRYESKRGIWRRLFSFLGFGYAPVIKSLRKLDHSKVDELQVLTCFIENMPKESQASYEVYKDIFSFTEISKVTRCLKTLHQSKLLTKENFNAVKKHEQPSDLVLVLDKLNEVGLLTQENFNAIKKHNNSYGLFRALSALKGAHLLTQENFNAVKKHNKPSDLAEAISRLMKADLLTPENLNAIKEHNNPSDLAEAISRLMKADLLTPENLNAIKEHNNPSDLAEALSELTKGKALTPESFNTIKEHNKPSGLVKAISRLMKADLLTPENLNAIKEHNNPSDLAEGLSKLNEADLLTPENLNAIKESQYPRYLIKALSELKEADLLTQENLNAIKIKSDNNFHDLTEALSELRKADLLTQENFLNAIKVFNNKSDHDFYDLTKALSELRKADLLTQENFLNAIKVFNNKSDHDFIGLARALSELRKADLLTQENLNAIKVFNKSDNDFIGLARALSALREADLLTQENLNAIKEHNNSYGLFRALSSLNRTNILTLNNFERLIQPQNNILLTLRMGGRNIIWDRIPPHLLTQAVFEELIRRALENPPAEIEQYINNLLLDNGAGFNDGFNDGQSTHTASIHHSVSTSATKLWDRYQAKLPKNKVEEIITTIKKDIANLSDTLIDKAAKNCIERITKDNYIFTDSKSKVTLKQLLALFYLAINDDKTRLGSLEDAKKQFIIGLYEIQRGYNLSAGGLDDKQEDRPICTAGTFNKLMEKLSGVHPDVELLFITKETATLKLPIIIREEVKNYLQKLSKPETKEGFHSFIILLEQLLKEGIEIIWNKIKPKVADRLFDEFKSVYDNNKENPDFLGLVDAGQYTQIENLGDYQQQIVSSAGYRKYCSQTLRHTRYFFQRSSMFFSQAQSEAIDETWKKSTKCDVKT